MNLYPINRWVAISGSSMATSAYLALSAVAQSTPPAGVTIPPAAPDAVEQTCWDLAIAGLQLFI